MTSPYAASICRLTWLLCFPLISAAYGEDIYVAEYSTGEVNGSNAANARAATFFNTAANWSSPTKVEGKIGPGDTVHLCGAISTPLIVHGSGLSGKVITILFESGASMSAPNWNQGGENGDAALSTRFGYVTINGGLNGMIQATSNGTGLQTRVNNYGVSVSNANNVTIEDLTVKNLYVRLNGTDPSGSSVGIYFLEACNNCLVSHCTVSDAYMPIEFAYGTCSSFEVANCTIFNMGKGIVLGSSDYGSILTGALIHNNIVTMGSNWEGYAGVHRACLHAFAVQSLPEPAGLYGLKVYSNLFTGDLANNATGYCFLEGFIYSPDVYSNSFIQPNADSGGDGFLSFKGTENGIAMYNTFIAVTGSTEIAIETETDTLGIHVLGHDLTLESNSFQLCSTAIYDYGSMIVASNHNLFYGVPQFYMPRFVHFLNLENWRTDTGLDLLSSISDQGRVK